MTKTANKTERPFTKEMNFCADSARFVAPQCSKKCLLAQLRTGHKQMGDTDKDVMYSCTGSPATNSQKAAMKKNKKKSST